MRTNHPVLFGAALALTVGIAYAACTLVFALFPDAAAGFMNALFHGLDFRRLQGGATLFSFGGFVYALLALMIWVFAFGTLFDWLAARFLREARPS